jgi:hypothetical protein
LTARIDALGFHRSHANDRVRRRAPELNEHKSEERPCAPNPATAGDSHDLACSQKLHNLSQERSQLANLVRMRSAPIRNREPEQSSVILVKCSSEILRADWWWHIIHKPRDFVVFV